MIFYDFVAQFSLTKRIRIYPKNDFGVVFGLVWLEPDFDIIDFIKISARQGIPPKT